MALTTENLLRVLNQYYNKGNGDLVHQIRDLIYYKLPYKYFDEANPKSKYYHKPGLLRNTELSQPIKISENIYVIRLGGRPEAEYYHELNVLPEILVNPSFKTPYENIHYGYVDRIADDVAKYIQKSLKAQTTKKGK